MFFLNLFIHIANSESIYAKPGTYTVEISEIDGYELLGKVSKPTNVKSIRDFSGYTQIDPSTYPTYSQDGTCDVNVLTEETNKIQDDFCTTRNDYRQDELFSHPAGTAQFGGSDSEISTQDRVKARVILNPKYGRYHPTGLYAPPGELITVTIHPNAINKISAVFNSHAIDVRETDKIKSRIPKLSCEHKLTEEVNTFGWPYGGTLDMIVENDGFANGVEVIISGCIEESVFKLGRTSDSEWEEMQKTRFAPISILDNGYSLVYIPTHEIRNCTSINDAMMFWKSIGGLMYTVSETSSNPRRDDLRVKMPVRFNFDKYVQSYAVGVTTIGGNSIQFLSQYSHGFLNFSTYEDGYWLIGHEYGHNFQDIWGCGNKGEVTNNVFNIISYSLYTRLSSSRRAKPDGSCYIKSDVSGFEKAIHPFPCLIYEDLLGFYCNFIYMFGQKSYLECLHEDYLNGKSSESSGLTDSERFYTTVCKYFKQDFTDYFRSYSFFNLEDTNQFKASVLSEIAALNYEPFHPIGLLYQSGIVVDGEEIMTGRPFLIPYGESYYIFDFNKYVAIRKGMEYSYEFFSIEGGLGQFTENSKGVYLYEFPEDQSDEFIDKFYVNYKDTSNDHQVKLIVEVTKAKTNSVYKIYEHLTSSNVVDAYSEIQSKTPSFIEVGEGMNIPSTGDSSYGKWLCVNSGIYYHSKSEGVTFSFMHNKGLLFYFSEEPLHMNPTDDQDSLRITNEGGSPDYLTQTYPHKLEANKPYYFSIVLYQDSDVGFAQPWYSLDGSGFWTLGSDNIYCPQCTEDVKEYKYTIPEEYFFKDETQGHYSYGNYNILDSSNYELLSHPQMSNGEINLFNGILYDQIYSIYGSPDSIFPQTFEIDLHKEETFDGIHLYSSKGDSLNYLMESNIDIKSGEQLIWEGLYLSTEPFIQLDKSYTCSKLTIIIYDNARPWGNNITGSSLSELYLSQSITGDYVIPTTNPNIEKSGSYEETMSGLYYNGKGIIGHKGSSFKTKIKGSSYLGVIGNKCNDDNIAELYINNELVDTIHTNKLNVIDKGELNALPGTVLYQKLLSSTSSLDPSETYEVELRVTEGDFGFAGFLVDIGGQISTPSDPTEPTEPSNTTPTETSNITPTETSNITPTESSNTDPTEPSNTDPTEPSNTDPSGQSENKDDLDDTDPTEPDNQTTGLSKTVIIAISAVAAVVVIAVVVVVAVLIHRRKTRENNENEIGDDLETDILRLSFAV